MTYKHFQFQHNNKQGGIDVQFNYSIPQKEIVWLHLKGSYDTGLPSQPAIVFSNNMWCLQIEYKKLEGGKEVAVVETFNNQLALEIVNIIFEELQADGHKAAKYFN
jgi:hypothetical protein